jgi:hypothetical protein
VTKIITAGGDVRNRLKESKNTLRWDKTSYQRFEARQTRLKMGILVYKPPAYDSAVLCLGRRGEEVPGLADQAPDQSGS